MSVLDILTEDEVRRTLNKFTGITGAPVWLTDTGDNILLSQPFDHGFSFDAVNRQLFSREDDEGIYLPESYRHMLHELHADTAQEFTAQKWLIGLSCLNGTLVWCFPLTYFNELHGFLVLSGVTFETQEQDDALNHSGRLKKRLFIRNDTPLQAINSSGAMVQPLAKLDKWLDLFALIGEELVESIHLKKLNEVRRAVTDILRNAHEAFPIVPPRVRISEDTNNGALLNAKDDAFKQSQDWIARVYYQLCQKVQQMMGVDHFAILIAHSEKETLRVIGSSEKERPLYSYPLYLSPDDQEEKVQKAKIEAKSVEFFKSFRHPNNQTDAAGLKLKVHIENYIPDNEPDNENLRQTLLPSNKLFSPLQGLWAPMLIQGRCVGLLRLLVDEDSVPLSPLHQHLFSDFATELNEYLETMISHYREAVLSAFSPIFSRVGFYSPNFFKQDNPFQQVALGIKRLLNCRAAIIRIKSPYDDELRPIGYSDLLVDMDDDDESELLDHAVLTNNVVKERRCVHYGDLYSFEAIQARLCQGREKLSCEMNDDEGEAIRSRIRIYKKHRLKSLLSIPVMDEADHVIGLINVFQGEHVNFSEHDTNGLLELAVYLSSFIQVKQLHDRIEQHKVAERNARQFYEQLSVRFNSATTEAALFAELDYEKNEGLAYFQQVAVWRCDRLPSFPFMELLYQATELWQVQANQQDYEQQINLLISQLKSIIPRSEAMAMSGDSEAAKQELAVLNDWLTQDLNKLKDQSTEDFFAALKQRLLSPKNEGVKGPEDILFPATTKRYFAVKKALHEGVKALGKADATYLFYYYGDSGENRPNFTVSADDMKDYLTALQADDVNNSQHPLLMRFPADKMKVDGVSQTDMAGSWIPLVDESGDSIYGLCHFVEKPQSKPELEYWETTDRESFYNNLMGFIARLLATRLERIWKSHRDAAVVELGKLFDLDKDPHVFFQQAATLIGQYLNAEATLILGTQSLTRDALIARGYDGFTLTKELPGRFVNAYLEDYVHKELKTTTHFAFKAEESTLLHNIRCHHYCRIAYIKELEKEFEKELEVKATIKNYCAVPIAHAGEAIGLIEVFNKKPQGGQSRFGKQDQFLLNALGGKLAQGLSNYELVREADAQVSTVVHGSRSPLHTIKGFAFNIEQCIEDITETVGTEHEALKELSAIPASMAATIDLAELFINTTMNEVRSKYESLDPETPQPFHFFKEIGKLGKLWHSKMARQKNSFILDKTSLEALVFRGGRSKILLLLANLLENAVKYSDSGEVITVRGFQTLGLIGIEIKNTGPRAYDSEEEQENLFRSFYRGRNLADKKGSGMGLPLCKRIVDHYFGTLTLISEPGQNSAEDHESGYITTVTFCLNKTGRILGD